METLQQHSPKNLFPQTKEKYELIYLNVFIEELSGKEYSNISFAHYMILIAI